MVPGIFRLRYDLCLWFCCVVWLCGCNSCGPRAKIWADRYLELQVTEEQLVIVTVVVSCGDVVVIALGIG